MRSKVIPLQHFSPAFTDSPPLFYVAHYFRGLKFTGNLQLTHCLLRKYSPTSTEVIFALLQSSTTISRQPDLSAGELSHFFPTFPACKMFLAGLTGSCSEKERERERERERDVRLGLLLALRSTSELTDTTHFKGIGAIAFASELALLSRQNVQPWRQKMSTPRIWTTTYQSDMTEVVRFNFDQLLPLVEECVTRCDFIGELFIS